LPDDRQVRFRIGVNLGDVMLQGADLLGDGVNVAARLQSAAEPGGICISGSVLRPDPQQAVIVFQAARGREFQEHSAGGAELCDR
jgi:adenylate cyclase